MRCTLLWLSSIFASVIFFHNVDRVHSQTGFFRFEVKTFCNLTVSPVQVLNWVWGEGLCGVICMRANSCYAYSYDDYRGCQRYPEDIRNQTCSPSSPGALDVYVKIAVPPRVCRNDGFADLNNNCVCQAGFTGSLCESVIEDCTDGYSKAGYRTDGMYWIKPKLAPAPFQVFCKMSTGEGWTKIQSRAHVNLSFNRTWEEYKNGFVLGDTNDFWLGNQKIHWLTNSSPQTMIIRLSNSTQSYQLHLSPFVMANETQDFAVTYTSASFPNSKLHNIGICWPHTSIKFSTYDRDNDGHPVNCASLYGAGFWFQSSNCSPCNPNGDLHPCQNKRLNTLTENFWTPGLGDWTPDLVRTYLVGMNRQRILCS